MILRNFCFLLLIGVLFSCKKDKITWDENDTVLHNPVRYPQDYTGINTIDSFWYAASYEGVNGSMTDTVVWYWLDSIVVGNNVYYPLSTNIPFVKEAVIGDELLLLFPETQNRKLKFRSIASSILTCLDLGTASLTHADTFSTWVLAGSTRINANHYSPLGYYQYANKGYFAIRTSFDSLNINSPTTFHRKMTWADSLGVVDVDYYRISRSIGDTIEHIRMDRIFR